jgi:Autographiviridae endonuclease VII
MDTIPHATPLKQCNDCHLWLSYEHFSVDNKERDGLFYQCRKCKAKHRKQKYNYEDNRRRRLRNTYGITQRQYDRMLEEQGGVCASCKKPETHRRNNLSMQTDVIRSLSVDHDHKTGDVRSLLCSSCNVALGRMNEDPERIRALADYADWCQTREPSRKIIQLPLL